MPKRNVFQTSIIESPSLYEYWHLLLAQRGNRFTYSLSMSALSINKFGFIFVRAGN